MDYVLIAAGGFVAGFLVGCVAMKRSFQAGINEIVSRIEKE